MNLIPELIKIKIERDYFDGLLSPTCTGSSHYSWTGYKVYKWLWFKEFKRKFKYGKDFEVFNGTLEFKKVPSENILIEVSYVK